MWQEGIVDGVHPFQCYRDTVDKLCKAQNWVPAAYLHFPIKDECLPDYDLTIEFLTKLLQRIEHGGKLYIHCLGGRGRGALISALVLASPTMLKIGSLASAFPIDAEPF